MKKLAALALLTAALGFGQSVPVTIQFPGENIGTILTVNPNGFAPEIAGIETLLNPACSGLTLTQPVTASSTTFTLSNASCVLPGNGIGLGCAAGGAGCTEVAGVKAAGCANNICPVAQHQIGTTGGNYPAGTPVTVTAFGWGSSLVGCGIIPILQALAQKGSAATTQPANTSFASTAVAAQNATIASAAATILSLINGAFTCAPTL